MAWGFSIAVFVFYAALNSNSVFGWPDIPSGGWPIIPFIWSPHMMMAAVPWLLVETYRYWQASDYISLSGPHNQDPARIYPGGNVEGELYVYGIFLKSVWALAGVGIGLDAVKEAGFRVGYHGLTGTAVTAVCVAVVLFSLLVFTQRHMILWRLRQLRVWMLTPWVMTRDILAHITSQKHRSSYERIDAGAGQGWDNDASPGVMPDWSGSSNSRTDPGDDEDETVFPAKEKSTASEQQISYEEAMESLNKMIGLSQVKEQIEELAALTKVFQARRNAGKSVADMSYHLVFTGNPGTGKTTVARLLGAIFRDLGILRKGHVVEASRETLVGRFLGETPPKVKKEVQKALDGILFIDEAYSLYNPRFTKGDAYGQEALDTLVAEMENKRDRLVVVAAGYPKEMAAMINKNAGLKSRFKTFITFEDFTPDELTRIFLSLCEEGGYRLAEETEQRAEKLMFSLYKAKRIDFGNARTVRNAFERTLRKQALRLSRSGDTSDKALDDLVPGDIPEVEEIEG